MHTGSCLCGSVTYTINGELGAFGLCHCTKCRKANGTAFQAAAQISPEEFKLDDPKGYMKSFESSPGVFRHFCSNCGSPLFSRRPGPPEVLKLRVGTLDTKLSQKPEFHIFYPDRAEWYEPDATAPRFSQGLGSDEV